MALIKSPMSMSVTQWLPLYSGLSFPYLRYSSKIEENITITMIFNRKTHLCAPYSCRTPFGLYQTPPIEPSAGYPWRSLLQYRSCWRLSSLSCLLFLVGQYSSTRYLCKKDVICLVNLYQYCRVILFLSSIEMHSKPHCLVLCIEQSRPDLVPVTDGDRGEVDVLKVLSGGLQCSDGEAGEKLIEVVGHEEQGSQDTESHYPAPHWPPLSPAISKSSSHQ